MFRLMVAWTSPGAVVGVPSTPPRRTSWAPTSPSPLRNSFTSTLNEDDEDEDDEGIPVHEKDTDIIRIAAIKIGSDRSQISSEKSTEEKETTTRRWQ
jgi:hypothetical protein